MIHGEMDRISQLPEPIIHHILSFLKTSLGTPLCVELVRMSVLSKTWFDLTASFPVLKFYIYDLEPRDRFFKHVEYTTSRFCHQNVIAQELMLVTNLEDPQELDIFNRCLELVLKKGVKMLVIRDTNFSYVSESSSDDSVKPFLKYVLPDTLLSVSVLKGLSISGCELPSSLMVDVVQFKSLSYLTLEYVTIDDEVIKYLTDSCPLLLMLEIKYCPGIKRFCISGHKYLEVIAIEYEAPVEMIDIEAPNLCLLMIDNYLNDIETPDLSNLSLIDMGGSGAPQMNLTSCKELTAVSYSCHSLPNSSCYTNFLSNFPFIEDLILRIDYKSNNLMLSSQSLRTMVLYSKYDLGEIELSTPNLAIFIYSYSCVSRFLCPIVNDKRWPPVMDSAFSKPCMHCYLDKYIDTLWFHKLRLYLDKRNGLKVLNLYIHVIYNEKFTEIEKLKALELPSYELEHVELQIDACEDSSAHITFVDVVLWCCRPRSLTLRSSDIDFKEQSDLIKFTYEKLLQQEDDVHTKIQILLPSSSEAQKHLMDLKSSSMALPRERNTISFIKENDALSLSTKIIDTHVHDRLIISK